MPDRFAEEAKAYDSATRLMREATEIRRRFNDLGLILPAPLQRMFGDAPVASQGEGSPSVAEVPPAQEFNLFAADLPSVPLPTRPPAPKGAEDDWIWVDIPSLAPGSLLLSIVRELGHPATPREIYGVYKR